MPDRNTAGLSMILGMATQAVQKVLEAKSTSQTSSVPLEMGYHGLKNEVATAVAVEMSKNPTLINATNQEPWYQSRVYTGLISSVIGGAGLLFGKRIAPEHMATLVEIISAILTLGGQIWSWYGRTFPNKPIGA